MTEQRFGEHYSEYVLGTLGEPQSREFEDHLVECLECREKLAELQEVLHSLPHALPQRTPPTLCKGGCARADLQDACARCAPWIMVADRSDCRLYPACRGGGGPGPLLPGQL